MPMSFPTFESLRARAKQRQFRQPLEDETEDQFRQAFFNFMRHVDIVESSEIRSGAGWDQQKPEELVSVVLDTYGREVPVYVWHLAIVELDNNVAVNLRMQEREGRKPKLMVDINAELAAKYEEEYIRQYTANFKSLYIVAEPKGFEFIDGVNILGEFVQLLKHNLSGRLYYVVADKTFAVEPLNRAEVYACYGKLHNMNNFFELWKEAPDAETSFLIPLENYSYHVNEFRQTFE